MTVNQSVRHAVRRALAIGAIAALSAGSLAAHAAQSDTTSTSAAETITTKTTTTKTTAKNIAKNAGAKAPILLAQTAAAATAAGTGTGTGTAAAGDSAAPAQLQQIVITGSLISRTSVETPNPVQVISSKDLVQSGYTDISDVLKNISANGASTLSQSFSFAFAAGASGISLRGLTVGDTLVLIDGERTIPYPLLDDNQRSFVDLASIPFTAIENVQVDKNGASAVYGSDAIAGVVNVILRKEYEGLSVSAEEGTSEHGDGTMTHIGFIAGHGDLASDGYNFYLSGDFRKQDQILASHRSGLWDSLDQTPWGGTWGGASNFGQSPLLNPLNAYPLSTTGYFIDPATGTVVNYLPGCNAQQQALNRCLAISPQAQLQPATSRTDILGKFTKRLDDNWTLGLQGSWFESSSEEVGNYPLYASGGGDPMEGVTNLAFGPGKPLTVVPESSLITPNILTIPTSNPMYPSSCNATTDPEGCSWFGSPLTFQYAFPELGATHTMTTTDTYRLLANLDGMVAGWDLHATGGAMYSRMDYELTGDINYVDLQNALNNGYVFGSSDAQSLFAQPMETHPWSSLDLVDVHGQHSLFDLPGGPVDLAVGVQYYKLVHDENAAPTAEAGLQGEGGGPIFVIGTEKDAAAFMEIDGKPIKQLEIDAAGRFDSIQGVGSAATPQLGVKFTPLKQVALRGTFGKGFRAPSAAEGGESGELFGAGTFTDPILCPNPAPGNGNIGAGDYSTACNFPATGYQTSNPHLSPVKSTNWTLGIVLQPVEAISAAVDYYNIKVENDIVSAFEAGGLGSYTSALRGAPVVQPYCPTSYGAAGCTNAELVNQVTPIGKILALDYPYVNSGFTHTSGFDVDLKAHWDAGQFGQFTAEATWTHLLTYQLLAYDPTIGAPVLFELAGTHGPSGVSGDTGNPKDRGEVQASWSKGPLTISPSLEFIGHFNITDPSAGLNTCSEAIGFLARFLNGVTPQNSQFCSVGYFLETNLYAAYQVSSDFQIHASITNLFNKVPPLDMTTYGSGSIFLPYDAAMEQDGAVGRYFTVGLTYDFE